VRRTYLYTLLALIALVLPASLPASSSLIANTSIQLQPQVFSYKISVEPIINNSEIVTSGVQQLLRGRDYQIDYRNGQLTFIALPQEQYVQVQFIKVPPYLAERHSSFEELSYTDSLVIPTISKGKRSAVEDGNLLISGSKTFAVSFSDDDAFDVKQTLFVNLDGRLADNVNIAAQLSDSQSKLTPEGDSKELSSLDKVFIRVYGKQYEIAMGDLDWTFSGTKYLDYQTNIEGLNAWYKGRHAVQGGFTAASGKPAWQEIMVVDGKQGPYHLNPTGFQSTQLIIAGSEKLYMNGRLLERGKDYYIDYTDGSVMFRILVTSSDSVSAYFSYSDEYYRQSTYLGSFKLSLAPGLSLAQHVVHQADSKNNPLLYDFTAADLDSLRQAGDNIVWGSGVTQVEPGAGNYAKLVNQEGVEYYQYAAGDSTACYNVVFSYVGAGKGDYIEFSTDKFRYEGPNLGSWLPVKRLVPAVKHTNADLRLDYEYRSMQIGVEGIFTHHDKNTFSRLDDADNPSGIVYAFGKLRTGEVNRQSSLQIDFEKRWANSWLFTQYSDPQTEFDLAALDKADSLAQQRMNLLLATKRWESWQPELGFRFSEISNYYSRKSIRMVSRSLGYGIVPAVNLRTTFSYQDYVASQIPNSLVQYLDLDSESVYRLLKAKFLLNYNSLQYDTYTPAVSGNRYLKMNPQLSFSKPGITTTQIGFSTDRAWIQQETWKDISSSQSYALKHATTTADHTASLDLTHREVDKSGQAEKTSYDLITLRNSHSFLKQAILLIGNYQLNQTEFFPQIRELLYVGGGLGLYDSTGVYSANGDYDYSYISSNIGKLSTELNSQISLYLKPGNIAPALKKMRTDMILLLTEQSDDLQDWRSYLFLPNTVYDSESTIYGKQNYNQTIWIDILPGKISGNLGLEIDRSMDNRYQTSSRTYSLAKKAELDLKHYWGNNFNIKFTNSDESDTRYMSSIKSQNLMLLVERNINPQTILSLNLEASGETGSQQNGSQKYRINGLAINNGYRGSWGSKGRVSASWGAKYNQRSGSEYLSFLPEKRDGFSVFVSASAVYRINSYTSASLDYKGSSYPNESIKHTLSLEFKAEL